MSINNETQTGTWTIDKQFDFCYGHRVWSQQLIGDYCEAGDTHCKCRHAHGHQGLVHVFLEGTELTRGMVTDFKHLGWLKNYLDDNLDHKFIIDRNDPFFANIINGNIAKALFAEDDGEGGKHTVEHEVLNVFGADDLRKLRLIPAVVPGTDLIGGYNLDVTDLSGPEEEWFEGFFIVDFLPTSEHLSKWVFDVVQAKMDLIDVNTARVDWFETPKSRSSYRG